MNEVFLQLRQPRSNYRHPNLHYRKGDKTKRQTQATQRVQRVRDPRVSNTRLRQRFSILDLPRVCGGQSVGGAFVPVDLEPLNAVHPFQIREPLQRGKVNYRMVHASPLTSFTLSLFTVLLLFWFHRVNNDHTFFQKLLLDFNTSDRQAPK